MAAICLRSRLRADRRRTVAALAAALILAACQPVPRAFEGTPHADVDPLARPGNTGIVVAAIEDAPPDTSAALAEAMAAALRDAGIPATSGAGNNASRILRGRVVDPGRDARIEWTLSAPSPGADAVRFDQSIEGTPVHAWALANPELMADLAAEAAPSVVALVEGVRPVPAGREPTRVAVRPVTGAPGDGDAALTVAMRSALIDAGVDLADEGIADLIVAGSVEAGEPIQGAQNIRISWLVTDQAGDTVGRITQESPVAANSLDGAWGDVAVFVAEGASSGITEILAAVDAAALADTVPAAGSAPEAPLAAAPPEPPPPPAPPAAGPLAAEGDAGEQVAAVAPAEPTPPPRVSTVGTWHVQLASFRTREQAETALDQIARRHTGLLGGYVLDIEQAELATGTVYRVRTSPITNRSAATGLCRELQAAGQDCFVIRS